MKSGPEGGGEEVKTQAGTETAEGKKEEKEKEV